MHIKNLSFKNLFFKNMLFKKLLFASAIIFSTSETFAHGDIHHRIDNIGKQLAKSPDDTTLLIQRGRLYLDAHHNREAKRDFNKALKLSPQNTAVYYYLAQVNVDAKENSEALKNIDIFLHDENQEAPRARGLALRGDILRVSGKPAEAAKAYAESLQLKKTDALPDDYVRLADTYLEANASDTPQALQALDQGITQLGNLQALQQRAIDIELQSNQPQAAVKRIDQLIQQNKPSPYLLLDKGKILKSMGALPEANETFKTALAIIDEMSPIRRNTPAIQNVQADIAVQMTAIGKK
jgi:tetratricopeptide (TPR) repeat protein